MQRNTTSGRRLLARLFAAATLLATAHARAERRPCVPLMRGGSWHVFGGIDHPKNSSQGS